MSNKNIKDNALVIQSGGCTPVFNRSLAGVVREALESENFGEVYGARYGLEGLLRDDLINLDRGSKAAWARISRTPGAALGSTRRKLRSEDIAPILEVLSKNNVRYMFIIGGNDSAETGHRLSTDAGQAGQRLVVMNVPKTIDNDLVLTDHSPGYGSAARFVALATMGAGRDAEAMGIAAPITIIEVMGRDAGWLAASSVLAKRDERDAPHLICVPEFPVDEDRFLAKVEDAYRRYGFAVAVVAENTRGASGVLGGDQEPWYIDDFGHPYFDGAGRYLAGLVSRHMNVRARYEKPGTIQRSMMACISRTDAHEAEMAGRAAVRYALEGHTDQMVTLVRETGEEYTCSTGLAPLADVAGRVRAMPEEYLEPSNYFVAPSFVDYTLPLIGGSLPQWGRLK